MTFKKIKAKLSSFNAQPVLNTALRHHQEGQLAAAEKLYQKILQHQPDHAEALHLLGIIAAQRGRNLEAIDYISRAIVVNPKVAAFHSNLGNVLQAAGRLEEAIASHQKALSLAELNDPSIYSAYNSLGACFFLQNRLSEAVTSFQRSLKINPHHPETYHNLANVLVKQNKLEEAIANYRQAIALNPNFAGAYAGLGNALQASHQLEEAIVVCRRALQLDPNLATAYINLAATLLKQKKPIEARDHLHKALQLDPNNPNLYFSLGRWYDELNNVEQAIANYNQALQLAPEEAETYNNLGILLQKQNKLAEAVTYFEKAIALNPLYVEAHFNLGLTLELQGKLEETRACYQRVIELKPNDREVHISQAFALFKMGNFTEAWIEFEWRLKRWREQSFPVFEHPQWDGSSLAGRRLLVCWEEGFGDTLQFVRYLSLITDGIVIFACQPPLETLFRSLKNVDVLTTATELFSPPPELEYDVWVGLMSLPKIFATTLENIPAPIPYLFPEPDKVAHWQHRFDPNLLNVGIVWAGNPSNLNDSLRSCSLAHFAALADLPNVAFFSVQKGEAALQQPVPAGFSLTFFTEELADFSDTAAMIACLDLVISVDTAVAHLAGALGKPVWNLLPSPIADWRWLVDREDSPWYPTMRLFRQPSEGDWEGVFVQVARELAQFKR